MQSPSRFLLSLNTKATWLSGLGSDWYDWRLHLCTFGGDASSSHIKCQVTPQGQLHRTHLRTCGTIGTNMLSAGFKNCVAMQLYSWLQVCLLWVLGSTVPRMYVYIDIHPCIHPSIHPSIYLYLNLSLSIYASIYLSLSLYLSIFLSVYLSLSLCLSMCLSTYLSFYPSIHPFIYLSIPLYLAVIELSINSLSLSTLHPSTICLSIDLFVYLFSPSICLPI
jgi:hypothetical protein